MQSVYNSLLVQQCSKPIVHFVIQAPNLAQMYTNMLRTFSDIGPLEILSVSALLDFKMAAT